ncbi:hypothetical protein [Candidatus Villigracilis saccharophilus]|uniref:hypothetical protein n=1 Tax=Candidatus Villigracilis saccharophilus TaxID=3140684 RepID=UPI0031347D29|nr:hypothetical protein [Anaerolineales bacterium]
MAHGTVIILLPVLLAVLIGTAAAQWLGRLSNGGMPPLAQTRSRLCLWAFCPHWLWL